MDAFLLDDRALWDDFRAHSRTFSLATRLLPRDVQLPVATLYLYCRSVDSVADVLLPKHGREAARHALDAMEQSLVATLNGQPPEGPLWPRLARVHARFGLPEDALRQLMEGARWDIEGCTTETDADLIRYSDLVGGCVGAMMLPFLTAPDARTAALDVPARDLGIGMQIVNILRDVGEDRDVLGRVYLPADRLRAAGVDLATLGTPTPAYAALLEDLMALAEARFVAGLAAVDRLLPIVQPAIRAAARMYREILNEIRAHGYDNLRRRAVVSTGRKITLTVRDDYAERRDALRLALVR